MGSASIESSLLEDLNWWANYLTSNKSVVRKIFPKQDPPLIYTDAEGSGSVGCLASFSNRIFWFQSHINEFGKYILEDRLTQIIAHEARAAVMGLSRFSSDLGNREVILFIDNMSVKGSIKTGRCKKDDIQTIIDDLLSMTIKRGIRVHPIWVPSSLNISDLPSRGTNPQIGDQVSFLPGKLSYTCMRHLPAPPVSCCSLPYRSYIYIAEHRYVRLS